MNTLFTINFRREAYLRAVARARQRVLALGIWVAYFGILSILAGLYGLNAVSLSRQLRQIERQLARARQTQNDAGTWKLESAEIAQMEAFVQNPREWHDRMVRLSVILPTNVRLSSIIVNPASADEHKLLLNGQLSSPGQDRMQGVMKVVTTIHQDSLFKGSYQVVKLASTKAVDGGADAAEFVIECR